MVSALAQTTPAGWKIVKDSKVWRIAVPPDWEPLSENAGAAVLQDTTTAIAVVTSQADLRILWRQREPLLLRAVKTAECARS
jgi:hypothetical protein